MQINLNMELKEILKHLIIKEGLAKQLMSDNNCLVVYKALEENEAKIASLEKERDELMLKVLAPTSPSGNNAQADTESETSIIEDDDIENDPYWRKTPLAGRLIEENKWQAFIRTILDFYKEDKPVKRSSDGGCTCKSGCSRGRCSCRKSGTTCSATCKCGDTCKNQVRGDSTGEGDSSDFKVPILFEKTEVTRRKTKARYLFSHDQS
ncbi:hypothetical protein JTB14_005800 [Gonioctena quinquepunctata]|nr:hypothetical protein JTB14_005800 [Gonioctena quinquepunctata]